LIDQGAICGLFGVEHRPLAPAALRGDYGIDEGRE
jgi:hypothetical protein